MGTPNEWKWLEGFDYRNNRIYRHVTTGELAWEERDCLIALPPAVEREIQEKLFSGRQTDQ